MSTTTSSVAALPPIEEIPPPDGAPLHSIADLEAVMRQLIDSGQDDLSLPGQGATAARWRELARVSTWDLSLAKIFESHTDALAILAELGHHHSRKHLLAVWAAENPKCPLIFDPRTGRLDGGKQWCSAAVIVDEGLVTAVTPDGRRLLVRVEMDQAGVTIHPSEWANAGIARAETTSVDFSGAIGTQIGDENAYLERPGFWQGAAGIAAVWYGGAVGIANVLARSKSVDSDPHAAAHLGAIHSQLEGVRALLLHTASWIDDHPSTSAMVRARTLRSAAESAAMETIQRSGRAMGAVALCTQPEHARRVADLEIFLRQSHAERDLAALGQTSEIKKWNRYW